MLKKKFFFGSIKSPVYYIIVTFIKLFSFILLLKFDVKYRLERVETDILCENIGFVVKRSQRYCSRGAAWYPFNDKQTGYKYL